MNKIAFFISIFFIPFTILGQDTSMIEKKVNWEIYFDSNLGLRNNYFKDRTGVAFSYGGGINLSWRVGKNIELKSGLAYHSYSYIKYKTVGCDALNYFCLPIKKTNNRFLEIPIWIQYQVSRKTSKIQTFITGGFIHQFLIHQRMTAFTEDGNIERDGSKGFRFNYWGGDFYVGVQIRKGIFNNAMNLFFEPNLRFSTVAFQGISVKYKYVPRLGLRIGVHF